jgi:hypothetical protein
VFFPKKPLEVTMTGVMAVRSAKEQSAPLSIIISILCVGEISQGSYWK